jgi:hypothetical protein
MTTRKTLEQMAQEAIRERIILTSAGYIADEDDDIQVYQRPWVDLTEDEMDNVRRSMGYNQFMSAGEYAKLVQFATQAKLKEKNT